MKWVLRGVIALLMVVVAVTGFAIWRINEIAEYVIETQGTEALGVDTTIDFISIRFLPPGLRVGGFEIENPPGFDKRNFFTLGSGGLDPDFGTLREETIVAPSLQLSNVEIAIERDLRRSNYGVILDNLKASDSGSEPPPPPDGSPEKKFRIDQIVVKNVTAHITLGAAGVSQSASVTVPEIRLAGVGSGSDGGAVTGQLLSTIIVGILEALARQGQLPGQLASDLMGSLDGLHRVPFEVTGKVVRAGDDLAGSAADTTLEALEKGKDVTGDAAREAVDKTEEGARKAVDETEKGARKLLRKLRD